MKSVTLTNGASMVGRAFGLTGAVTMDTTDAPAPIAKYADALVSIICRSSTGDTSPPEWEAGLTDTARRAEEEIQLISNTHKELGKHGIPSTFATV